MRHNRAGFTLIELLIVVVIIGILAAIAIPKFAATKVKGYVAVMKSDLRNLATAQEAYVADNGIYFNGVVPNTQLIYNPSSDRGLSGRYRPDLRRILWQRDGSAAGGQRGQRRLHPMS
jgi:prepilin-type N-terminal cleavage/methylation domain-containing protein